MPTIFQLPKTVPLSSSGTLLAGAKLYFYETTTSTPKDAYQDFALGAAHSVPVEADGNGVFPPIFLENDLRYRVTLKTAAGATIYTVDDVGGPVLTQSELGVLLYPRTAAETSAGVTPTNYAYAPGDVRRYGAVGDGVTDDSSAFTNAALVCGKHPMLIPYTSGGYKIVTPFALPNNATVQGIGRPTLFATVAGTDILYGSALSGEITINGVIFQGVNSSTTPLNGRGGQAATSTGLVTLVGCNDVRVSDCDFSTFYNGLSTINCQRLWVLRNRVQHWLVYGILGSLSGRFWIDYNDLNTCDQSGAANAYGIMATGNNTGAQPSDTCSISFNDIKTVQSWDGIMTHDVTSLRVIGNKIEDVRQGIDVGHFQSTNVISDVLIANNIVKLTTANTWGAASAIHAGICCIGYGGAVGTPQQIQRAVIVGNEIYNYGNIAGGHMSGDGAPITIESIDNCLVSGNLIAGVGNQLTAWNSLGIYAVANLPYCSITGNVLQGQMPSGGIRLQSCVSGAMTVAANSITQTNPGTDNAIYLSGGTLTLALGLNSTNAAAPIVNAGATVTYSGNDLIYSGSWAPGNIANGASAATSVTVTGASPGDFVQASISTSLLGCTICGNVTAANTVQVVISNTSGGAQNINAGGAVTLAVRIRRQFA